MQSHVTNKGWTAMEQYCVTDRKVMSQWDVPSIPHVMLVDQQGKVVFKGHPAYRPNLAADLTKLFKGQPLW